MPTQNVNLTSELDDFVKEQVASGYYNNASEVHRAALAAMVRVEEERQLRLDALRGELKQGIADLEGGRSVAIGDESDHEAFFAGLRDQAVKRASSKG